MKGTFFKKPFEFSLQIDGETWPQSGKVEGRLIAKNHSPETLSTQDIRVFLALGKLKGVQAKKEGSFQELKLISQGDAQGNLPSGQSITLAWKLELDQNAPITDSTESLFVLYGLGEQPEQLGHLQLKIEPHGVISEWIKPLVLKYRFLQKSQKAGKKGVEIKLVPSGAKEFATLDFLLMNFWFDKEILKVTYEFNVKIISPNPNETAIKKEKRVVEQELSSKQYLGPNGRIQFEAIERLIPEAVATVTSKITF